MCVLGGENLENLIKHQIIQYWVLTSEFQIFKHGFFTRNTNFSGIRSTAMQKRADTALRSRPQMWKDWTQKILELLKALKVGCVVWNLSSFICTNKNWYWRIQNSIQNNGLETQFANAICKPLKTEKLEKSSNRIKLLKNWIWIHTILHHLTHFLFPRHLIHFMVSAFRFQKLMKI